MTGQIALQDYAVDQMNQLLATLASQVQRAAKKPGPDQIHDLRVSIRRFSQGLDLFAGFFPKSEAREIHRTLKRMMRLTSSIRDRDIAIAFLAESQGGAQSQRAAQKPRLSRERSAYQRQFSQLLRQWTASDFSAKWRGGLTLSVMGSSV
jgi:CHAD domain-containing protein